MRSARLALILAVLVIAPAVFAQTTSPLTSTSVFDLQAALSPVTLDSNLQYVSGTGVRLTSSASMGVASYSGTPAFAVNNVVPSWNVDLPAGTGIRTEVRAVNGGTSTVWYEIARFGTIPGGIQRKKSDDYGYIDIDTLMLYTTWPQIEYRVTLYTNTLGVTPTLRLMSVCYADTDTTVAYVPLSPPGVTTSLPVPWRSQYWVPDIGGVICGPTSCTMALDYYGWDLPTETVAADCYDSYNKLYGNWPMIAQAAAKRGFKAYTLRTNGQQFLRDQFSAGNACIMTMAYSAGELTNSPISSTGGHLVLMVGVTSAGDYICNDPAGSDSRWDHVVYYASEIAHVWLYHGGGVLIAVMPNLVYGRYPYYTYQSNGPILTDTVSRMMVFARGFDGWLYAMRQSTANGSWGSWTSMGGPIVSDPVVATNRTKGNIVLARQSDGNVYYRSQSSPGGSWSAWSSLGGPIQGKPAVGKSPDGRLDVFCRMTDGSIQHKWEASGGGWQSWESFGGTFADDPVIALTWEGREEVYARGTDNHLYRRYQLNDGSWSSWGDLGGPVAGQPVMGRTSDGRTEVYCRYPDGSIRCNVQSSLNVGTSWGGWTVFSTTPGSDPVLARTPTYLQEMYITDTAGAVLRCYQSVEDGAWSAWESLGGTAVGRPIVGHHDDGRIQVLTFRSDGKIWGRSQSSGGGWGGWTVLSPSYFADVVPPTISSVALTPSLSGALDPVLVQVTATDNAAVQGVTADGTPLNHGAGNDWSGYITASDDPGSHSVLIQATDTAGNSSSNSSHSYTTTEVYSLINPAALHEIMLDAQSRFAFTIWGSVTVLGNDSFTVNDGSGTLITVQAANHGRTTGQFVIVSGVLTQSSPTEASLTSNAALIHPVP